MKKSTIIKYSVTLAVGAGIVALALSVNSFSLDTAVMSLQDRYRILANAFSTSAALLLGVGALVFISSTGQFDGISYLLKHLVNVLVPGKNKKEERFYDYKTRKAEGRTKGGFLFLLICGAVYAIPAVIFILLFHSV